MKEGGIVKRIFLLAAVVAVVAATLAGSVLSSIGHAQGGTAVPTQICAPWSKEWDVSEGYWYFTWYRWCYDPSVSDPSYEENWYTELGNWEWSDQVNMCPESGTCTMSPGRSTMITGAS